MFISKKPNLNILRYKTLTSGSGFGFGLFPILCLKIFSTINVSSSTCACVSCCQNKMLQSWLEIQFCTFIYHIYFICFTDHTTYRFNNRSISFGFFSQLLVIWQVQVNVIQVFLPLVSVPLWATFLQCSVVHLWEGFVNIEYYEHYII